MRHPSRRLGLWIRLIFPVDALHIVERGLAGAELTKDVPVFARCNIPAAGCGLFEFISLISHFAVSIPNRLICHARLCG